jgi:hypothetical protein
MEEWKATKIRKQRRPNVSQSSKKAPDFFDSHATNMSRFATRQQGNV